MVRHGLYVRTLECQSFIREKLWRKGLVDPDRPGGRFSG